MTRDALFDRARQMVAQSPAPTTLSAQLAKLARRRRPAKPRPKDKGGAAGKRYPWQDVYQ